MSHLSVVDIKEPGVPAELEAKIARAEKLLGEVRSEMNQAAGWHREAKPELGQSYAYVAGQIMAAEKLLSMLRLAALFVKDGGR